MSTVDTLRRIESQLRSAGADLPVRVEGTIESAMKTGLSIALAIIVGEMESEERAMQLLLEQQAAQMAATREMFDAIHGTRAARESIREGGDSAA